jgi:hypothetical protein
MNHEIELSISCNDCVRRATPDCADCLVSYVLGSEPDSLELTSQDAQIAELFVAEGLVPRLKFVSLTRRS